MFNRGLKIYAVLFLISLPFLLSAQSERHIVAEWEPAWGTLIRWPVGIPSTLVVELAESDTLYVLVESFYERDQAIASFESWNVNMNHTRFLFAATYSHWTRDWGPHMVFDETGTAGIADPVFDGYPWVPGCNGDQSGAEYKQISGYEEDDAVNAILADTFSVPLISLPTYLTGGNIMVDGHRTAISTQQMLDENIPVGNADYFKQIAADSLGISNYIIVDNPEVYGIQHIDCYAKYLNESTILVKEVDTWNPEYACCEALANHLGNELNCWGDPYEIVRIYCGAYNGSEVAAYTNSLILNKKVLVPLFDIESDAMALQTYQQAMPGYEIIGFDFEDWYYYDALHCRTMGIFDKHMLQIVHKPLKGDVVFSGIPLIIAMIDDRSEKGIDPSQTKLHWRQQGNDLWYEELLQPMEQTDSFFSFIPYPVIGTTYDYYLSAGDSTGRYQTLPVTAPANFFTFKVDDITAAIDEPKSKGNLLLVPTVFTNQTTIYFEKLKLTSMSIWDSNGQQVYRFNQNDLKGNSIKWNGENDQGKLCKPGTYIIKATSKTDQYSVKCILTH